MYQPLSKAEALEKEIETTLERLAKLRNLPETNPEKFHLSGHLYSLLAAKRAAILMPSSSTPPGAE
jgi:hypothetical protein